MNDPLLIQRVADEACDLFGRPLSQRAERSTQAVLLHDLALLALDTGGTQAHVLTLADGGQAFEMALAMHAMALDSNDRASESHLGAAIIPAALEVAALTHPRPSGSSLLRAVAIGWQVASRLGEARVSQVLRLGIRPSAVFGPMGAAVATSLLSGLSAAHVAHSIALTLNAGGGLTRSLVVGSDDWRLQLAFAAETGVRATRLAAAGYKGALDSLDPHPDRTGWHGAEMCGGLADPGSQWRIVEAECKRFPACNVLQSALACAWRIHRVLGQDSMRDARVTVLLNPHDAEYPGILDRRYTSPVNAMMSAAFTVATMIATGRLDSRQVWAAPTVSTATEGIISRLDVRADQTVQRGGARLEVESDGRVLTESEPSAAEYLLTWDRSVELSTNRMRAGDVPAVTMRELQACVRRLPSSSDTTALLDIVATTWRRRSTTPSPNQKGCHEHH